jgi:predicted transcriptional regulator
MSDVSPRDIRPDAHRLVDSLPEDASWEDVMYRVYVRQCIDAGIDDADSGRVIDVEEVRRQFGLNP